MTQPPPTITCCIAASQMAIAWVRLTIFLLRAGHAFLHTCHRPGHSDLDIFDQHQQLLIRCTLRIAEGLLTQPTADAVAEDAAAPVSAPPVSPAQGELAADLWALLHDLS